uniref:Uncharacterized protein n=1 Tax=Anas platyrhynchos platyrhynchos TaxID=8840 RepID=A0A493T530_ANAPP
MRCPRPWRCSTHSSKRTTLGCCLLRLVRAQNSARASSTFSGASQRIRFTARRAPLRPDTASYTTPQRLQGRMARRALVLVLCLSLAAAASADCATQCSLCAGQGHGSESSVRPLMCLWECQGSSPPGAEWETCRKALALLAPLVALAEGTDPSPVEAEDEAEPEQELSPGELPLAPAKRYGGFMKKLAKGKLLALLRENAHSKGGLSKKFGGFSRKPGGEGGPRGLPGAGGRGQRGVRGAGGRGAGAGGAAQALRRLHAPDPAQAEVGQSEALRGLPAAAVQGDHAVGRGPQCLLSGGLRPIEPSTGQETPRGPTPTAQMMPSPPNPCPLPSPAWLALSPPRPHHGARAGICHPQPQPSTPDGGSPVSIPICSSPAPLPSPPGPRAPRGRCHSSGCWWCSPRAPHNMGATPLGMHPLPSCGCKHAAGSGNHHS